MASQNSFKVKNRISTLSFSIFIIISLSVSTCIAWAFCHYKIIFNKGDISFKRYTHKPACKIFSPFFLIFWMVKILLKKDNGLQQMAYTPKDYTQYIIPLEGKKKKRFLRFFFFLTKKDFKIIEIIAQWGQCW